jgi:GxxExxY protein
MWPGDADEKWVRGGVSGIVAHGTRGIHRRKIMELIHQDETYRILGACFEVYKNKGCGFLEAVYQECLEIEFEGQGIEAKAQVPLALIYKGRALKQRYVADFICYGKVIVELKAVSHLTDEHRAQLQNYLNSTGMRVGLLVNFGHYPKVEHERFVL